MLLRYLASMPERPTARLLTSDERAAAEAAFSGRPFNPRWSASARSIYEGILKVLPRPAELDEIERLERAAAEGRRRAAAHPKPQESPSARAPQPSPNTAAPHYESHPAIHLTREEALKSGALIDVTPIARRLGFSYPMAITRTLWEEAITASGQIPEPLIEGRVRDVLMALRLRFETIQVVSPLIGFPALLAIPPQDIPQPYPLYALIQPDRESQAAITLLHPCEVSASTSRPNEKDKQDHKE
jgi:hypothetical protein